MKKKFKYHALGATVIVTKGDFQDITAFENESFDGIYVIEAFAHADNSDKALREFYRLLKPGGALVLHHVDFKKSNDSLQEIFQLSLSQYLPAGQD